MIQSFGKISEQHVTVVAMNEDEAEALTGESDPLAASDKSIRVGRLSSYVRLAQLACLWRVTLKTP